MGISFVSIIIGVLLLVGLGTLVVWLCKQVGGAKNSMSEAKAKQEEIERDPIDFE